MIEFLTKPYPYLTEPRERWLFTIGASIFVFLFLYVFRPFGINSLQCNLLLGSIGYGGITFFSIASTTIVLPAVFPSWFKEEQWTVLKHVAIELSVLLLISIGNACFTSVIQNATLTLQVFLDFIFPTFTIGFFPLAFYMLLVYKVHVTRHVKEANQIETALSQTQHNRYANRSIDAPATRVDTDVPESMYPLLTGKVLLGEDDGKNVLSLEPEQLLFIGAADNYINVVFTTSNPNKPVEHKLLRATLKSVEEKQLPTFWFKCHRSYIVNLRAIQHVEGNSQGLRLYLNQNVPSVPVARAKVKELHSLLA